MNSVFRISYLLSAFLLVPVLMSASESISAQDPQPTPAAASTPTPTPTPLTQPTPIQGSVVPPTVLPDDPPPVAPNFAAPLRPMPTTERVGVDVTDQLPLTLEEAIELALKNNNNIDASRNDVRIAEFNLLGTRGAYDPLIGSESYYESLTTPTASLIGGAVNGAVTLKRLFSSSGITGNSPFYGGAYSARFDSSKTDTSNTNAFLNPQYPTVLNFTYVQPLMRNFRIDNNRRQIEIAKKNLSISDAQFRQQAIDVIALVEQSYWNLAFALRNLMIQIDAVRHARTQLESNMRLVEKGVIAPIDVVAATAQITTYEQAVFAAQEDVTRAENSLKVLMLAERTAPQWSRPLTPVSPINLDPPKIGLSVATNEALKNRPELAQLENSSEINRIDQAYFRNQSKPQIDLVGSYTAQGLAGTVTTAGAGRVPENLIGGYGTSLGNMLVQDYPSYRIGVSISLPWKNTLAEANLGRSLVEADRIGNQRAQTEQVIEAEVRNSLQALRSAEARLSSALASRLSAEQLAASEERQFRAGATTFYLVLQRQNELLAARGRELQAQTDLNKAISEFQRATGTTLSANNVTVSDKRGLTLTNRGQKLAINAPFFVRDSK